MKVRNKKPKGIGLIVLVGFFILLGLWATGGHYLAPRPTAEMFSVQYFPPGPAWFLEQLPRYETIPVTTFLHVIPALLFFLLLGLQLNRSIRAKRPTIHRVIGRVLVALSLIIGVSGLVIGYVIPFGGLVEMFTSTVVGLVFIFTLYKGVYFARQKDFSRHREWMLRMVAVAFAPLTMRIIFSLMMTSPMIDARFIFGPLMIASMVVNFIALEFFIIKRRIALKTMANTKLENDAIVR